MDDHRALEELADRLSDERRILTQLLYKLTVTELLLPADDPQVVAETNDAVDRTVELLYQGTSGRNDAVHDLAGAWQTAAEQLTLASLAEHAPAP